MFTDCVQLRLGSLIKMWVCVHCSLQLAKKSATVKLRKANFPYSGCVHILMKISMPYSPTY